MRGYSRRQVDDFVARCRGQIHELEERLGRALDEGEQLRQEVTSLRQQALGNRPAHEEVSERISQILKLADDEAKAQKNRADDDIKKQLTDASSEADRVKKEAREQAEHMLTAAQEQAERTISAARNEADKTRTAARTEADRLTSDTRKKADQALAQAKAQAKKVLDEATARATAIHDGAERRLNLLSSRHTETVRRLADILDGVQGLVAAENARMTLEEEVSAHAAKAIAMAEAAEPEHAAKAPGEPARPQGEDFTPADFTLVAPPAADPATNGGPALGRPSGGRPAPSLPDSPPQGAPALGGPALAGHAFGGPPPGGPALPPPSAQSLPGLPPPGLPHAGPVPGNPGLAGPGFNGPGFNGPGLPGPGMPPPQPGLQQDRNLDFEQLRDPIRTTGTIDPDEPTEGIRLMP